jgi:TolA-binding protein
VNAVVTTDTDPAEEAYDVGYQLWKAGKYDEAVGSLRAFTSSYPKHRRASWANNLAGRALLDKGQPRAAAEVLLANYRGNPKGERAADSLFYLGQSLVKLGQPAQACKAYAELESVYGDKVRGELKTMLPKAKAEAKCA